MADESATAAAASKVMDMSEDPCEGDNFHPGKAWLATIAAALFILVASAALNMLTPVLKMILTDFNANTNFGSDLNAINTLASAIAAIPIGLALNKWGFRKIGHIGLILLIVSSFWGAFCYSEGPLLVVRALQGVGYACAPILGTYLVVQWFPKRKRAVPIAVVGMMIPLARAVSLQVSKIATAANNWHIQFITMTVMCIIAYIFFIFFMKPGPGYAVAEAERRARADKKKTQEKAPLSVVLKNPYVWAGIIIFMAFSIGQRGFSPFANMIFVDNCGVSNNTASDINSIFSVLKIVSCLLFGWICTSMIKKHRGLICAILSTIYFIGMGVAFVLNTPAQAWLFAIIVGAVGGATSFTDICVPIFSKSPAVLAMALSLYTFLGKYIAGTIAPYIISFTQNATGSWVACGIPVLIVGILAAIASWFLGVNLDKFDKLEKTEDKKSSTAA